MYACIEYNVQFLSHIHHQPIFNATRHRVIVLSGHLCFVTKDKSIDTNKQRKTLTTLPSLAYALGTSTTNY